MNMMTSIRPHMDGPLMAHISRPVVDRLQSLLVSIDALIDVTAGQRYPFLAGCAVQPFARFIATGTSCQRPLLLPEARLIAQRTGFDTLLLRHDPERGTTFDFALEGGERALHRYVAWRRRGNDVWFIPTSGDGPFIRATDAGLLCGSTPPFLNLEEREAGIIRAIASSSFEGSL